MTASDDYSITADGRIWKTLSQWKGKTPLINNSRMKFLQYVKTDKESICFVEDNLKVDNVFVATGMEEADNYNFVASDGFSMEVAKDEIAECNLVREGDSINAAIPALTGRRHKGYFIH